MELRGTPAVLIRDMKAGVEVLVELLEDPVLGALAAVVMVVVVGLMVEPGGEVTIMETGIVELFALFGPETLVHSHQHV